MLTIVGKPRRYCDGIARRSFLKIGGLGLGGLSLPNLLRAEDAGGARNSHKSVIMVFLPGGPSHLDIWDLKPQAPVEIRGEFKPIQTTPHRLGGQEPASAKGMLVRLDGVR